MLYTKNKRDNDDAAAAAAADDDDDDDTDGDDHDHHNNPRPCIISNIDAKYKQNWIKQTAFYSITICSSDDTFTDNAKHICHIVFN